MEGTVRIVIAFVVAVVLVTGCVKRDMDECRKGDRSRCPGEASVRASVVR